MGDARGGGKHNGVGGEHLDPRADDHIEQLQAWFTQETETELQEVTLAGDRDHHRYYGNSISAN